MNPSIQHDRFAVIIMLTTGHHVRLVYDNEQLARTAQAQILDAIDNNIVCIHMLNVSVRVSAISAIEISPL